MFSEREGRGGMKKGVVGEGDNVTTYAPTLTLSVKSFFLSEP